MLNLTETLRKETRTLLAQYLDKTEEWANSEFDRLAQVANAPYPRWEEFVKPTGSLGYTEKNGRIYANQDYAGQKEFHKAEDRRRAANRIMEAGFTAFAVKLRKAATEHYEDSIIKLAARIGKKGLNQDNLTIKTAHVGVNIETVFTDGTQTVKAWTIIASGPVQKPHYRYLVK